MNPQWRIELLGGLRVVGDDRIITRFQTRKFGLLLAYLAYYPRRTHPRADLVELLWPESEPSRGRNNLSQALTSLRRQLEPPGVPGGSVIVADRTSVSLNPDAYVTDVAHFETALQTAALAGSPAERAQQLAVAVHLYQGELLPGFCEPWILPERVRLAEAFLAALGQLVADREQAGDHHGALQWARRAVSADSLREEAHREVMRLLAAMGQPDAARRQYRELERLLAAELDAEPEAETRALIRELGAQARHTQARVRPSGDAKPGSGDRRAPDRGSERLLSPRQGDEAAPESHLPVPPSGKAVAPAARLPLSFTRFFGREGEITQLCELLSGASPSGVPRLVTLTGPGGSGKTRLAQEVAARLQDPFRGAVWFAPLVDLSDARLIVDKTLDTLRLPRSAGLEPLDQIVAFLARQRSLLVLDNFEHLVDDGTVWVQALREQVPTLTCLVTSRRRLDLSGEREFPVPPLPTPEGPASPDQLLQCESVRLFVDRAQAVRPDFQLTPGNAAAVAALCARLEGIPLALELAAARAWVLTPAQMFERLSPRFELLVSRQRDLLPRHRSLRATLDWSYELLTPELQRFFAQLCIFRGGWSLEAAEAVCDAPKALNHLEQLRECSLILVEEQGVRDTRGGQMRFRMLETVREYAREQLASEELAALERRHAAHFLALAEEAEAELRGRVQGEWLKYLEAEHDNFRAALGWSRESAPETGLGLVGALWRFWLLRGHVREGRGWLADALAHPGALRRTPARAKALCGAGEMARYQGDFAIMDAALEESMAIWQELGDQRGLAHSLSCLGMVADARAHLAAARSLLEESVLHFRATSDRWGLALALTRLGMVALRRRDHREVRLRAGESLPLWQELGDKWGLASPLRDLGIAAWRDGNSAEARFRLEASLGLFREVGDWENGYGVAAHLGHLARREGDYAKARALFEESLAIQRERGRRDRIAYLVNSLGQVTQDQGNYRAAGALYKECLEIWQDRSFPSWIGTVVGEFAGLAVAQGQLERAARLLGATQTLFAAVIPRVDWACPGEPCDYFYWWPLGGPGDYFHEFYFNHACDRIAATVRAALGEAAFESAWEEGRQMTLEQAVRDASDWAG